MVAPRPWIDPRREAVLHSRMRASESKNSRSSIGLAGVAVVAMALAVGLGGCRHSVAELDADDLESPLLERAVAHEDAGEVEAAVQLYRKSIDVNPTGARAHLNLAFLLEESFDDFAGAIYHYRRYIALRPGTDKAAMIRRRVEQAEQAFAAQIYGEPPDLQAEVRRLRDTNDALRSEVNRLGRELAETRVHLAEAVTRTTTQGAPLRATGGASTTTTTLPPTGPRQYTVMRGDNLTLIAERFYGDRTKYRLIANANRALLRGRDQIRPGQVLVIPPDPDAGR